MYVHILHETNTTRVWRGEMQTLTLRSIKTEAHKETKMMFWFLFASSRGAMTRIRIVELLKDSPSNAHQISKVLSMDYKAVKHHLDTLESNNLIGKLDAQYGKAYFASTLFEENQGVFDEIASKISFKLFSN